MLMALDYDDTFTLDPKFWTAFIKLAQAHHHVIYCVTMRYPTARIADLPEGVLIFYTSHKAKKPYMSARGWDVDVWIDDSPAFVLIDAKDAKDAKE